MKPGRPILSLNDNGQSTVELVAGLIVLVPIVLGLFDMAVVIIANQVNDSACRDAARVAASGRPTADETTARATQVLKQVYHTGGYLEGPALVAATPLGIKAPDPVFGGPYSGSVRVETKITVHLPAPLPGVLPATQEFHAREEYPVTFVEPNTASP